MNKERASRIIDSLIESLVEFTRDNGMNTENEIRDFVLGEITYAYKTNTDITLEQKRKLADALSDAVIRKRYGKKYTQRPTMEIYIARDRAVFEDEQQENFVRRHPEKETEYGRIRLFYEKPTFNNKRGVWECAREAAPIKTYMFPNIKCEQCVEFTGPELPQNE